MEYNSGFAGGFAIGLFLAASFIGVGFLGWILYTGGVFDQMAEAFLIMGDNIKAWVGGL